MPKEQKFTVWKVLDLPFPTEEIEYKGPTHKRTTIVCEPVPGPNGTINYVQDWIDLTHFG